MKKWSNIVNILHLSDLHFGIEKSKDIEMPLDFKQKRELILEDLIDALKGFTLRNQKIDFIVISGDIGWYSTVDEYTEFEEWFERLMRAIDIDAKQVIICPGNHDFNRGLASDVEFLDKSNVYKLLSIDNIHQRVKPFDYFQDSCSNLGITALNNSAHTSSRGLQYLCGYIHIKDKGIVFSVFNSAWNESKTVTRDSRWLGLSLVRSVRLDVKKNIVRKFGEPIVISVFHHPLDYMNTEDSDERYSSEETTKEHLEELSSIVLNGHTHGGVKAPGNIGNNIRIFKSGSVHSTDTKIFEFQILSIDIMRWSYKQFVGIYEQSRWKIEPFHELGNVRQTTKYFKYGQMAADIFLDSMQNGTMDDRQFDELQPVVKSIYKLFESSANRLAEDKLYVSNAADNTNLPAESSMKKNNTTNLKEGKKNEPII